MQNHTTREILTALQYLLIGLAALVMIQQWQQRYGQRSPLWEMAAWLIVAGGLSLLRIIIILFIEWVRGNRWQSIRRRNWD